jgi:hypothetical protein
MLQLADVGVASGNAHASTKEVADVTGCTVEEHLMPWILAHVLAGGEV